MLFVISRQLPLIVLFTVPRMVTLMLTFVRVSQFVAQADNGAHVQIASHTASGPDSYTLIRYDQFFDALVGLLKKNDGFMTNDDVRRDLVSFHRSLTSSID